MSIEASLQHKLRSTVLPPDQFLILLKEIQSKIIAPQLMFGPISMETLSFYYKSVTTHAVMIGNKLMIEISVPIFDTRGIVSHFLLNSLPIFYSPINAFLYYEVDNNLMMYKDRKYFSILGENKFSDCLHMSSYFCPFKITFTDSRYPVCELNLFKGSTAKCRLKLFNKKPYYFSEYSSGYLFSVKEKLELTLVCYSKGNIVNSTAVSISNVGYIGNVRHCDIASTYFFIQATQSHRIEINIQLPEILELNVNLTIFLPSNHELRIPGISQEIRNILSTRNEDVGFTELSQEINHKYAIGNITHNNNLSMISHAVPITSSSLCVLMVLSMIVFLYFYQRRCLIPARDIRADQIVVRLSTIENRNSGGNDHVPHVN